MPNLQEWGTVCREQEANAPGSGRAGDTCLQSVDKRKSNGAANRRTGQGAAYG